MKEKDGIREPSVLFGAPTGKTAKEKPAKVKRVNTQWPDGFRLDDELRSYAESKGILKSSEVWEKFENYHRAKGSTFRDWRAAWRTWVANEVARNPDQRSGFVGAYSAARSAPPSRQATILTGIFARPGADDEPR